MTKREQVAFSFLLGIAVLSVATWPVTSIWHEPVKDCKAFDPLTTHVSYFRFHGPDNKELGRLDFGPPIVFTGDADASAHMFFKALKKTQQQICGRRRRDKP